MANASGYRKVISFVLVLGGGALLAYGLLFHTAVISSAEDSTEAALARREPNLIREVAVGGLERDASGEIKKTYTGQAPEACPT